MAYIVAADLRELTRQPWASDLVLGENDASNEAIDTVIAQVTSQIELDLRDDFEPPNPDNDETRKFDGFGGYIFEPPSRVRAITTLATRQAGGTTMTTQGSGTYYHSRSLNAAGTAMALDDQGAGRKFDRLEAFPGLTTGCWPSGLEVIWITGKFGWAAVPTDIKRLVALNVYDRIKASADPLTRIQQRVTIDATIVLGESREMNDIKARYQRGVVAVG